MDLGTLNELIDRALEDWQFVDDPTDKEFFIGVYGWLKSQTEGLK